MKYSEIYSKIKNNELKCMFEEYATLYHVEYEIESGIETLRATPLEGGYDIEVNAKHYVYIYIEGDEVEIYFYQNKEKSIYLGTIKAKVYASTQEISQAKKKIIMDIL